MSFPGFANRGKKLTMEEPQWKNDFRNPWFFGVADRVEIDDSPMLEKRNWEEFPSGTFGIYIRVAEILNPYWHITEIQKMRNPKNGISPSIIFFICWWHWCWWHRYVGDFMMVTHFRCWWQNKLSWRLFSLWWWFSQWIKSVINILNRSSTHLVSSIRHQQM